MTDIERVLVAGDDRLDADEQRQVLERGEVLDQRVLELLDRLPAPHVAGSARCPTTSPLRRHAGCCLPGRVRAARPGDERVGRRRERRVLDQRAVAVAVAAVAGLHEPVEAPGRVRLVRRLLDQLLHRDRAVRAGGVVVEVAGDVRAGRAVRDRAVDLRGQRRRAEAAGSPSLTVTVTVAMPGVLQVNVGFARVGVAERAAAGRPGVAERAGAGVAVVRRRGEGDRRRRRWTSAGLALMPSIVGQTLSVP